MRLYVCWGTWRGATPKPFREADRHPCGVAHEALLAAGHDPKVVRCFGWARLPGAFNFTPGRLRVRRLTGSYRVPVLETDSGEIIAGSEEIATWARRQADSQ